MDIAFTYIFQNNTYPTTVSLKGSQLIIQLRDFPCDFSIIKKGEETESYTIDYPYPGVELAYSKPSRTLELSFIPIHSSLIQMCFLDQIFTTVQYSIQMSSVHTALIGERLVELISSMDENVKIVSLTHISSEVHLSLPDQKSLEICSSCTIRTNAPPMLVIKTRPKLLTLEVINYMNDLEVPLNPLVVYPTLCTTAGSLLILDEVLGEISGEDYVASKYKGGGFQYLPSSLSEIKIYYRAQHGIGVLFHKEAYMFSIVDLGMTQRMPKIPLFSNCLHHVVTCVYQSDSRFEQCSNPVNTANRDYHKVEFFTSDLVRLAFKMLLSYIQNICTLEFTVGKFNEILVNQKIDSVKKPEPGLACEFNLSGFNDNAFDVRLELSKKSSDLFLYEIKIDLSLRRYPPERREVYLNIKDVYERYFRQRILKQYLNSRELIIQYIITLMHQTPITVSFYRIMKLEIDSDNVEIKWGSLIVSSLKFGFEVRVWKRNMPTDLSFTFHKQPQNYKIETNIKEQLLVRMQTEQLPLSQIISDLSKLPYEDLRNCLKQHS